MEVLPRDVEVRGKLCVVVGSGRQAAAIARRLADAGASVRVVASRPAAGLASRCNIGTRKPGCETRHIEGAFLVVVAASTATARAIERDARQSGIKVVTSGQFARARLAAGERPAADKHAAASAEPSAVSEPARAIMSALGDDYAELARILKAMRPSALQRLNRPGSRATFFESLADDAFLEIIRNDGYAKALLRARDILETVASEQGA